MDVVRFEPPEIGPSRNVGAAGFATVTLAGLVLDRLFSLVLTVLVSAAFGVGRELDTYLLAFAGPALLAAILGDLVYSLLLPELVSHGSGHPAEDRWNIAVWAVAGLLAITVIYMACWVVGVSLSTPGPGRTLLIELGLLTSPMIFFGSVGALGATMLIAERRYVIASLRIPIASLTAVVAFLALARFAKGIEILAVSVVAGALIATVVVVVSVFRVLGPPVVTISPGWSMRLMHRLGGTSFAQLVAGVVAQAPIPIERLVAFNLGAGVVSSLNYGRVLVSPPLLIAHSIATAAYPRFVQLKAGGEPGRYDILSRSIGMVAFLLLPLTVLLIVLAPQLVELVYHRGAFDRVAATRTTVAAAILAGALVPSALCAVLTRFLYAERASERVARASVATLAVYSVSAVVLAAGFGYAGLATASIFSSVFLTISLVLMVGRSSPTGFSFFPGRSLVRSTAASALIGGVVVAIATLGAGHTGLLAELLLAIAAGAAGVLGYLLVSLVIRSPELDEALAFVRRLDRRRPPMNSNPM